jgi:hypothetical protein
MSPCWSVSLLVAQILTISCIVQQCLPAASRSPWSVAYAGAMRCAEGRQRPRQRAIGKTFFTDIQEYAEQNADKLKAIATFEKARGFTTHTLEIACHNVVKLPFCTNDWPPSVQF